MFFSRFKGALLSWVAIPVSVGVFFVFLAGLISISYHPIAPGIHLVPVRIALAAVGVIVYTLLAIRHSGESRRTNVRRNAKELAVVPPALLIILLIWGALFPQSDRLRLTYRGDTFNIPRVYSPRQSTERYSYEFVSVEVCRKTGDPVYKETCNSSSYATLSTDQIISKFFAYHTLNGAEAIYDGDIVKTKGRGAEILPDGSFRYRGGGSHTRFLLGASGQIERFMHCFDVTGSCTIATRTSRGILTFPAKTTDIGAANFWRNKEDALLAAFDSWKCTEVTCGGRFE